MTLDFPASSGVDRQPRLLGRDAPRERHVPGQPQREQHAALLCAGAGLRRPRRHHAVQVSDQ